MRNQVFSCGVALAFAAGAASAQVTSYDVEYVYNHDQTGPSTLNATAFVFYGRISATVPELQASTLASPGSAGTNALYEVNDGIFGYIAQFDTEAALLEAFPPATYTFDLPNVVAGPTSGTVNMPDPIVYPSAAPMFDAATWTAMRSFDVSQDFTLNFNTFTTAAPLAQTLLLVIEKNAPNFAYLANLEPGTTSVVVPGGSLTPSVEYLAELIFTSYVSTPDGGFGGAVANALVTSMTITPMIVLSCPSDFNGDGFVNGDDFDAFVIEFEAGSDPADFDHNGFVNGDDFDGFVEAFVAGC